MQEYFSLDREPLGVCHLPVTDGPPRVGRWSSPPSGSFIRIPGVLAELSERPQQKWTSGLSQRPLRGGGGASGGCAWIPKLSKLKGAHVCAPPGTP